MKKTKKKKVSKVPKALSHDEAFNIGWDSEQTMADFICKNISETDEEAIDTAFVAAFQALTNRMLHFWDKEMLLEIVNDISDDISDGVNEEHVCADCQEQDNISEEERNKLH